jgi:hypothetical protein
MVGTIFRRDGRISILLVSGSPYSVEKDPLGGLAEHMGEFWVAQRQLDYLPASIVLLLSRTRDRSCFDHALADSGPTGLSRAPLPPRILVSRFEELAVR